ncbi:MAG: cytochrome C oxidase subunit IV family protein [Deltaproteobacteria bacterium]|nr:cytochrome C oxidase subunit IV family protein [Deltaproteobacteria bacterium]
MADTAAAHNEAHAEPNYLAVFGWLFVLTVIEVGVIFLPIPKLLIAASLVILAAVKASLVAIYFMHLKFERVVIWWIAVIPVILCVFLIFMLIPELA